MAEINDLNVTDASNTARFPENQAASTVNDGARALEGLIARWHTATNGSVATTGSSNAYVLADPRALSAYYDGLVICFDANHSNTGAATINVDSLGAKAIRKANDQDLVSGDIEAGQKVMCVYDGTNFQMLSQTAATATTYLANIVEDTSPQLGGFLDPNSNYIGWAKGADIASASPLVIGTDGNCFDVTGTTGFAAMTVAVNRLFMVQFDGALTMTHHATNLDLPGEADITTEAGDSGIFFSTAANQVHCLSYTRASGEPVVLPSATTTVSGAVERATVAEVRDPSTDGKFAAVKDLYDGAAEVSLSDGASIALDFDTGINFTVTLAGNRALANPTNEVAGKSGYIRVVQDATGSRTLSFGTDYEFALGTAPTLTTTANAQDMLFYQIIATNRVLINPVLDVG